MELKEWLLSIIVYIYIRKIDNYNWYKKKIIIINKHTDNNIKTSNIIITIIVIKINGFGVKNYC